jgi:hypothetical protein
MIICFKGNANRIDHSALNPTFAMISEKISQIQIEQNPNIDKLVESAVFETLEAIRKQVKIKQWQQILEENEQNQRSTYL